MTPTTAPTIPERPVRNGVDTGALFSTLDAIRATPELATFRFRATNRWLGGAHNRSTIREFYGAGQEDTSRAQAFELDAGEPAVLIGHDTGPNPAETLLHALAACVTTSMVYVAAARKVELASVESTLEGDMDVRGCLGLDEDYRNGFARIRVAFRISGDATEEQLRDIVARGTARSAVFDMVTRGVPVEVGVDIA
ncbi:MAG TPA: OsmC family protein [Baekduia sp.]|nr:OsmC family protein [Baekduia sp.]